MDNIVIHIRKDLHSKIELSPWSLKSGRPKPAVRHPTGGGPEEFTQTTSPRHPKMSKKQNSNINIFREVGKFGRDLSHEANSGSNRPGHNRNFWSQSQKQEAA